MSKQLLPAAQRGVGIRLAHDPGDPLITSHCPFCGSGQVVGRSDGTISCDFCGQVYIVRVQPAFPGMPQAPMGPGAPSDIGPDGGVLPPDAMGPDGLPMGGAEMGPDGEPMDDEGFPPDDMGDGEGAEDEGFSGPPGDADDDGADDAPPPPKKKDKKDKKKGSLLRTYTGLDGTVMTEEQYTRHLAAALSGGHPAVLAQLRSEARGLGTGQDNPDTWPGDEDVLRHVFQRHPEIHGAHTPEAAAAAHRAIHQEAPQYLDHRHNDRVAAQ